MRKIIVHEFISLDGVIQAPGSPTEDTDGGFTHGGWTMPYWHDDIGAHFGQIFADADTLLLGRKTWQTHGEAFEPDPEGDPFNGFKKYVVSTTLKSADAWRPPRNPGATGFVLRRRTTRRMLRRSARDQPTARRRRGNTSQRSSRYRVRTPMCPSRTARPARGRARSRA